MYVQKIFTITKVVEEYRYRIWICKLLFFKRATFESLFFARAIALPPLKHERSWPEYSVPVNVRLSNFFDTYRSVPYNDLLQILESFKSVPII